MDYSKQCKWIQGIECSVSPNQSFYLTYYLWFRLSLSLSLVLLYLSSVCLSVSLLPLLHPGQSHELYELVSLSISIFWLIASSFVSCNYLSAWFCQPFFTCFNGLFFDGLCLDSLLLVSWVIGLLLLASFCRTMFLVCSYSEFLGPSVGGFLCDKIGFAWTVTATSSFCCAMVMLT